jgi:hypothetical protein
MAPRIPHRLFSTPPSRVAGQGNETSASITCPLEPRERAAEGRVNRPTDHGGPGVFYLTVISLGVRRPESDRSSRMGSEGEPANDELIAEPARRWLTVEEP